LFGALPEFNMTRTKPFRLAELIGRVGAHLRRRTMTHSGASTIRIGELEIDNAARRVILGGNELPLRAKEFDLLARLAASIGVAVSREDLMLTCGTSTGSARRD
jgi:DNA-binding response OmpR family regulator